jgi:hypothetical protein
MNFSCDTTMMKAAVFHKIYRRGRDAGTKEEEPASRARATEIKLDETSHISTSAASSTGDVRADLMCRQTGNLNIWKAPIEGRAPLRYAKRCSRSPSPIPRRKVSFRLSKAGSELSLAETEYLDDSVSSSDIALLRFRSVRDSTEIDRESSLGLSGPSVKSSLKVTRHSVSLVRSFDPILSLRDADAKRVVFATVTVYLHSMILGDNPSVSAGLPVQIDWKPVSSFTRSLDEYEREKGPPRSMQKLKMSQVKRENMLKQYGWERDDVALVLHQVALIQASRAKNAGEISVDAGSLRDGSPVQRTPSAPPRMSPSSTFSRRVHTGQQVPKALRFLVAKPKIQ